MRRGRGNAHAREFLRVGLIFACAAVIGISLLWNTEEETAHQPEPSPSKYAEKVYINVYDAKLKEVIKTELEEYIARVTAAEMPASFEIEALKAQAIAARTYSYQKMTEGGCNRAEGADICTDSSHCQAYSYAEKLPDRVIEAAQATAGLILAYEGKPIIAMFHSSSGGETEDVADVYGRALPYLVSVASTGEETSSRYVSEVKVTREAFAAAINSVKGTKLSAKTLQRSIKNYVFNASGSVASVEIGGKKLTGTEMRRLFKLNSTKFTISFSDDEVVFTVRGYGHGVGMSQYGANALAKDGADYKEILFHYYKNTEILSISP